MNLRTIPLLPEVLQRETLNNERTGMKGSRNCVMDFHRTGWMIKRAVGSHRIADYRYNFYFPEQISESLSISGLPFWLPVIISERYRYTKV